MRCPWYLFHRLFLSLGKDTGAPQSLISRGPHELSVRPWVQLCMIKCGRIVRIQASTESVIGE
ncbi:unnamed protein product [Staurois parvus]|uniref:Uncharacterized protein n=1 Tax=Staurois parvus TaxID=386267 RepID=A0ABN9B1Q9_9NEOB|nr:unnamed protein product [Staurois parvus]